MMGVSDSGFVFMGRPRFLGLSPVGLRDGSVSVAVGRAVAQSAAAQQAAATGRGM